MPIRLLFYLVVIWQEHYDKTPVLERRAATFRLPPVVSVVFYKDVAPLCRILYHFCRASGLPHVAEQIISALQAREVPMADLSSLFLKLKEECVQKELERTLREQHEAILRAPDREGANRAVYQADTEGIQAPGEAMDFLYDLAKAPDTAAFLKERFGH